MSCPCAPEREAASFHSMRNKIILTLKDGKRLALGDRTVVVGVLNVTPDSFSDGGQHFDRDRAVERALEMESDGADIIEVGGESTRPGSDRVSADEEKARVLPVINQLAQRLKIPIAVDTYKSEVAREASDLGATIINDVSALRFDPKIANVAAETGAALVLMHMRGEPATMQKIAPSADIFLEIKTDFEEAISIAETKGVAREKIILDPGIGFGKTLEQNLAIINQLETLAALGFPIMIGTSRKSFIGRITGRPENERVFGTAASVAAAIIRGAHLIRVHDVKEMVEVARVTDAIIR
jgi:dihydropteroate synthase